MLSGGAPEPIRSGNGLRLRGEDADDLAVISACLQDALVAVRDLAYDRGARTFILVANRFRWEGGGGTEVGAPFARTLCGVAFENIDDVAYRGFHRSEYNRILSRWIASRDRMRAEPHPVPAGDPPGLRRGRCRERRGQPR